MKWSHLAWMQCQYQPKRRMVIMYMQYIYHIAIRRERRVGTKNEEVTGTTDSQRPMTLGEFGSSAGQTRSDKLTRQMKRKVDFSGKRRKPRNTQNN